MNSYRAPSTFNRIEKQYLKDAIDSRRMKVAEKLGKIGKKFSPDRQKRAVFTANIQDSWFASK